MNATMPAVAQAMPNFEQFKNMARELINDTASKCAAEMQKLLQKLTVEECKKFVASSVAYGPTGVLFAVAFLMVVGVIAFVTTKQAAKEDGEVEKKAKSA